MITNIWALLGIIAVILLVIYWRRRNSVWGGLALGIIIGLVLAIVYAIKGNGFSWYVIGKAAIVGTLLGFVAELLGRLSDFLRNK
ncbi:MAG: hypothetical protein Q8P97_01990 [bacterium]|nr:hypothetical protein [bacterium]